MTLVNIQSDRQSKLSFHQYFVFQMYFTNNNQEYLEKFL